MAKKDATYLGAHVARIRKKGKPRQSKKNKYGLRRSGRKN